MVTIVEIAERKAKDGNKFCSVTVAGDLTPVLSETGKVTLVSLKASVPSNLPKEALDTMIGSKLPGKVERVECEPYTWVSPSTGETQTLSHTYVYNPTEKVA